MVQYGVLVISHGSRDPEWVRLVDEAVASMKVRDGIPVECSFLEIVEGRLIQDGIDRLEAQGVTDVVAVPLFVSSGSTHYDEIGYALGAKAAPELETDLEPFRLRARVHWLTPMDDSPEMVAMLSDMARGLSVRAEQEMLVLVAHGSKEKGFHARWRAGLQSLAAKVGERCGFARTDYVMLLPNQAHCKLSAWKKRCEGLRFVVVPVFMSEGYFTKTVIPSRLEGFEYVYDGRALLPNPLVSEWLTRQAGQFLASRADVQI